MTDLRHALGGLALSTVQVDEPMQRLVTAHWQRTLARLGVELPLWVVHDLGLCAVRDPSRLRIEPRPLVRRVALDGTAREHLSAWAEIVREAAASETLVRLRRGRVPDDLLCAILVRVLSPVLTDVTGAAGSAPALPREPGAFEATDDEIAQWFAASDRTSDLGMLAHLVTHRARLLLALEQLDLATVRLLGMFGTTGETTGIVDLVSVLERVDMADVVDFSLDLLPSVLEARPVAGAQVFGMDGYAGVVRQGGLDSLVMSELAFDADLFARRLAENEVLYYSREKHHEERRRLCYLAVDATAAMRGQRSVFARGLALALAKKLSLQGEQVHMSFFDSRLYEPVRIAPGRPGGAFAARLLTFRGERGRHYAKVFDKLAADLERRARRERRAPVLYVLTHAECHLPRPVLERLRAVATLYGVFILPSLGELELEHLDLFHTVQVVGPDALREPGARARRALSIVDDATAGRETRA